MCQNNFQKCSFNLVFLYFHHLPQILSNGQAIICFFTSAIFQGKKQKKPKSEVLFMDGRFTEDMMLGVGREGENEIKGAKK